MEDLNSLRIKKQLLLIELNSLEQKISLLETTVTDVPESASLQTKASPQQTAAGKDSTNPLKAGALLKSIMKETATPLPNGKTSLLVNSNPYTEGISKMTILSPTNKTVQELKPDYRKALDKEATRFYVIYKGPHAGIHTDWGTTETFCKVDKVTCKKFPSEASARLSIAIFKEESSKKTVLLRPKIQTAKEDHRDQRLVIPESIQHEAINQPLEFEDFRCLWNKARAACPEDLVHEKFYTTDKKTKSLFNFIEGADARLIQQAYSAGLIDNIYPSANLQELKFLPSTMVEKIKTFRRKVLKAKDEPLYIRFTSSIPEWIHGSVLPAYHFVEVGIANSKKEIGQSMVMNDMNDQFLEVLHNNRINGLRRICEKILEIIKGSKKKVNYADSHCIVTSWSYSNINPEDVNTASAFGEKFFNNSMQVCSDTCKTFCKHAQQLFEGHLCRYCKEEEVTIEDVNTEDDKPEKDKASSSQ